MDAPHNAQIILRANQLWEEAGSPEGRTEEFYAHSRKGAAPARRNSSMRTLDNILKMTTSPTFTWSIVTRYPHP